MVDDDLRKKTVEAFNEKFSGSVGIDKNGNAFLKYDSVLDNKESIYEDILYKISTFIFGTSNEIKDEMYKNNNLHALSKGEGFDTAAYVVVCTSLFVVPVLIPDQNIQYIVGADAFLRISPVLLSAGVDLFKQEKTGMDHKISPGIVGSIRDYVSMAKS